MFVQNFYKYKRKICNSTFIKNFCFKSEGKIKIIFFGTDNFSLPSLKLLHEYKRENNSKIETLEVVTSFKSPINPIRKYATVNYIPLHNWPTCKDIIDFHKFNIGIVVSFGYLIPSIIISKFQMGMINLHASLLPRWRGAAPIIHAIANGDTITGVTIMKIEPKHFDIGDILYQEKVLIGKDILMPELHETLAKKGSKLILKTIQNYPECFQKFQRQNDNLVLYAPKVSSKMNEIHWNDMTANKVYNLYRALYSYKNLATKFQDFKLKIIDLIYNDTFNSKEEPSLLHNHCGFVQYCKEDNTLIVLCKDQTYIKIKKLKIEGKKVITASDFNNGFLKKYNKETHYFK